MFATTASPAAGLGILAALGYTTYWVVRSRGRWRTIMYALLSVVITLVVGLLFGVIFPVYAGAIGTMAAFLLFIAMGITAAEHSRFTIRKAVQPKDVN